jgi:hypothetical protein
MQGEAQKHHEVFRVIYCITLFAKHDHFERLFLQLTCAYFKNGPSYVPTL